MKNRQAQMHNDEKDRTIPGPKKNSPEILALSNDAQAVLTGHWMLGAHATLTLQNQKSVLSDRGRAAMNELIDAGIISDEKADDGYAESRTYRVTSLGLTLEYHKSLKWMDEHGKFSITEPIS